MSRLWVVLALIAAASLRAGAETGAVKIRRLEAENRLLKAQLVGIRAQMVLLEEAIRKAAKPAVTSPKPAGQGKNGPASRPTIKGLVPGVDIPFEVKKTYIDKNGRIINPNDCDGDSLPDDWEIEHFGNTSQPRDGDTDGDGLTNIEEYRNGTDPGGLFATTDGGETWSVNEPLWTLRNDEKWFWIGIALIVLAVIGWSWPCNAQTYFALRLDPPRAFESPDPRTPRSFWVDFQQPRPGSEPQ